MRTEQPKWSASEIFSATNKKMKNFHKKKNFFKKRVFASFSTLKEGHESDERSCAAYFWRV